jgi:hypothetical protein
MKNGKVPLIAGLGCAGVLGVVLLASCTGLMIMGFRSASAANGEISTAIDELMRAAADGTFAETYQSATTPEFRQSTTAANYAKLGDVIKIQLGALRSKQLVRINLKQVNANTLAEVAYQGTFEHGNATIDATLKRSGRRWLFMGFRVNSPTLLNDLPDQTCHKCGGKYAKSARFCPHCGQEVQKQ